MKASRRSPTGSRRSPRRSGRMRTASRRRWTRWRTDLAALADEQGGHRPPFSYSLNHGDPRRYTEGHGGTGDIDAEPLEDSSMTLTSTIVQSVGSLRGFSVYLRGSPWFKV